MGKGARNREIRRLAAIAKANDKDDTWEGKNVQGVARRMRKNFYRRFVRNGN